MRRQRIKRRSGVAEATCCGAAHRSCCGNHNNRCLQIASSGYGSVGKSYCMTNTSPHAVPTVEPTTKRSDVRRASRINHGEHVREGAGVRNIVAIGGRQLPYLDPFLLFAEFGGEHPSDYVGGFPNHPHRGFETLTYVLDGRLKHADSAGNAGQLGAGAVQRMKAARGIIHAEMPDQADGRLRAIQIWLNLPARHKMDAPGYQDEPAENIPVVEKDGITRKVLVGKAFGVASPIAGGATDLLFLDLILSAGSSLDIPVTRGHAAFAYVADGSIQFPGNQAVRENSIMFSNGDHIHLSTLNGARVLIMAARPIGEPIARHGPFVMNTDQEIQKAFADFQSGQLA